MRRLLLLLIIILLLGLPLKAQDFSLADILTQSASAEDAELTILLFAISQADADLFAQLRDSSSDLTLLAPSDAAFIEFMAENSLSLRDFTENPLLLNAIVRYHLLGENLGAAEIAANESVTSLYADNPIAVSSVRNSTRLNDSTQIIRDGFVANNGILHLIDGVLVPPSIQNMLLNQAGASSTASMNMVEVLQSRPELGSFTLALEQTGLLESLADSSQNFTLFAPTNAAFEAAGLSAETLTGDVLLYHALDTVFTAGDLLEQSSLTTLQGANLNLAYSNGTLALNEAVFVSEMDILASNGVIHVVNAVLEIPQS